MAQGQGGARSLPDRIANPHRIREFYRTADCARRWYLIRIVSEISKRLVALSGTMGGWITTSWRHSRRSSK
jgi:hypothetical protein